MRWANTFVSNSRAGTPVEIVGVAQKYQLTTEKPMDFAYMPLAQRPIARMTLMCGRAANRCNWSSP
jgi:hypothetical protein